MLCHFKHTLPLWPADNYFNLCQTHLDRFHSTLLPHQREHPTFNRLIYRHEITPQNITCLKTAFKFACERSTDWSPGGEFSTGWQITTPIIYQWRDNIHPHILLATAPTEMPCTAFYFLQGNLTFIAIQCRVGAFSFVLWGVEYKYIGLTNLWKQKRERKYTPLP